MKVKHFGPGVYIFYRHTQPLYIGSTRNLATRPKRSSGRSHTLRTLAKQQSTHVETIPCTDYLTAYRLESRLILQLHPKYNRRVPRPPADLAHAYKLIREMRD